LPSAADNYPQNVIPDICLPRTNAPIALTLTNLSRGQMSGTVGPYFSEGGQVSRAYDRKRTRIAGTIADIILGIERVYKHVLANISRSRYNTSALWTKWNGARSRLVHFIAGEGCLRRHA